MLKQGEKSLVLKNIYIFKNVITLSQEYYENSTALNWKIIWSWFEIHKILGQDINSWTKTKLILRSKITEIFWTDKSIFSKWDNKYWYKSFHILQLRIKHIVETR